MTWVGQAASAIAAVQTSSVLAADIRNAHATGFPQLVEGYIAGQPGALQAVATIRDEQRQQTTRTLEARGATVLEVASNLATQISSKTVPYSSANPEAVRELFSGHPEKAIALDPDYGAAHMAHVEEILRRGDRNALPAAVAAARAANLSEVEKKRLAVVAASSPKERSDALLALARTSPNDPGLWRQAAEAALVSKDHASAVDALRKAAELEPENVAVWNTLAYAQAFAGDLEGAKQSIQRYETIQPQAANAHDSLGEIYFYEGRFAEAEQEFLRAFEKNNALLGGADLYRAGLARFLTGDRAGADAHVRRYLDFRKQHGDTFTDLREAVWLYTTGRTAEARQKAGALTDPPARAQLATWDVMEGKRAGAFPGAELAGWQLLAAKRYQDAVEFWRKVYDANSLISGNEARITLAWALHGAGKQDEARALLAKWPFPPSAPDPGFGSIALAKAIELKAGHR